MNLMVHVLALPQPLQIVDKHLYGRIKVTFCVVHCVTLILALFPPYKTWKNQATKELHDDSWSTAMHMFRWILGDHLDVIVLEGAVLALHTALRDCLDEIAMLQLLLQIF